MKEKFKLFILMFFFLLFLCGWGKKKVELLNDKKLIDLNIAIEICKPGADGLDNQINTDNDNETEDTKLQNDKDNIEDHQKIVIISIENQIITYNSVEYTVDSLKNKIQQDYSDKVLFKVEDNFAEAHVYKDVIEILSELESEIGLVYTESKK